MKTRKNSILRKFMFTLGLVAVTGSISLTSNAETTQAVEVTVEENVFYVSGVREADKNVTILVQNEADEIVYIDQEKSNSEGTFYFTFLLPPGGGNGTYTVRIGGEDISEPWETTVEYTGATPYVHAAISGNCITVSGNLQTGADKAVTILARDPENKIVYIDQDENNADGTFSFVFLLPVYAINGEYSIFVGGEDINEPYCTLVQFADAKKPVEITQNDNAITVAGCLYTGSGKTVTILVQSPKGNIAYIDQTDSDENGLYSFEFLIPPSFSSGVYTVRVGGEDILEPYTEVFTYDAGVIAVEKTMTLQSIVAGETRTLHIKGQNLHNPENKSFTLHYDTSALQIADLCVYTYEKELEAGQMEGTHVFVTAFDAEKGEIQFRLDVNSEGSPWSGTLNGFRFVGKKNSNTIVRLTMDDGK